MIAQNFADPAEQSVQTKLSKNCLKAIVESVLQGGPSVQNEYFFV